MKSVGVFVLISIFAYTLAQNVELFDNTSWFNANARVNIDQDEADLAEAHPELLGVHSYCYQAENIWILHTEKGFTGLGMCALWTRPNNKCNSLNEQFAGNIKSVRRSGEPGSYTHGTVTIYNGEYFSGNSTNFHRNTPDLPDLTGYQIQSFVINGAQPVTVFERPNYQGYRKCYADRAFGISVCAGSLPSDGFGGVGSMKIGKCEE